VAGYLTKPTWIKAIINKQFVSWPGLTVEAVQIFYPESEETHKGHGWKTRSGLRPTKKKQVRDKEEKEFTGPCSTVKCGEVHIRITCLLKEATGKLSTNQTGQFPKKSQQGYEYIMTLYEYNSNTILVEPMKNRTSGKNDKGICEIDNLINQCRHHPKAPRIR
jgi:hypothetical protein